MFDTKAAFLLKQLLVLCQIVIITLVYEENAFFAEKMAKIGSKSQFKYFLLSKEPLICLEK
jgi:hypothetical protein